MLNIFQASDEFECMETKALCSLIHISLLKEAVIYLLKKSLLDSISTFPF